MTPSDRPRTSPVLKIRCKSETIDEFVMRYSVDFSRGGVFVKTRQPLTVGSSMRFEFQLMDGTAVLGGKGHVSWVRETDIDAAQAAGMGISFDDVGTQGAWLIERLVRSRGHKPSRFEVRPSAGASLPSIAESIEPAVGTTPSRAPSGLFSALTARPLELSRSASSTPLAERLKAISSAPPAGPPQESPSSLGRAAPLPPALPFEWENTQGDEPSLELAEEPFEPHPAPAGLVPPSRGPRSAPAAAASVAGTDAIGQLTSLIEDVFHAQARKSSRPETPGELDLREHFAGEALSVEEGDIEELATTDLFGELAREERRSGHSFEAGRLSGLVRRAAGDRWASAPPSTWFLFVLFVGVAISGFVLRRQGPEALGVIMEPLVEFLRPVLEDLNLW